jgi:hypothetical protein
MLVRLLYASSAVAPVTQPVLDQILGQSRRNNPSLGVTGLLCVSDQKFIQVLEGGRDEVCELYNAIVRDSRHERVRLLTFEETLERRFGAWTMGQVNITKINPSQLLKYFKRAQLDPYSSPGQSTMALLNDLVATASIINRSD